MDRIHVCEVCEYANIIGSIVYCPVPKCIKSFSVGKSPALSTHALTFQHGAGLATDPEDKHGKGMG